MSDRAIEQAYKRIRGERIFRDRAPPDVLDERATALWLDAPTDDTLPEHVASWPKRRREIVREYHEPVMESLSRYGALP